MELSQRIKYVRTQEKLSRREMSELTGIAFQTLTNYENERRAVTASELLKITNHPRFRKYALFLVTDDADQEPVADMSPSEFDLLIDSLTDDEVDQVVEYMTFLLSKRKEP